jgi:hypothetical protein
MRTYSVRGRGIKSNQFDRPGAAPKARNPIRLALALVGASLVIMSSGCRSVDPAASFNAKMDQAPPEKRPKGWEQIKQLIARPAPAVGQAAPDFTLPALNGTNEINRAAHQDGRPLVLIFGSFT